ncbi:IclR family transcriptional regulator [Pusillimonas sp. T2]|uniref:IclR family transcriptional regulator n=1 Tax=Pusillimonas sp. T2 TaxID=1548123 RepID=UPI000B94663A|nr:IclR family transcriptional regulator [Pusillimonas sp. T2]OXR49471.1 IclR family transcriptional regulator [Pusillimonas sp. T2]
MDSKSDILEKRGIQSIEVGYALLEALQQARRKLPLKLLAEAAGMPSSKAHLYLVSFMRLGLIVQDKVTGHYGLGPTAIRLGAAAIEQFNVVEVASEYLESLQANFEQTYSIAIWGNRGPTIIYKLDGRHRSPFAIKVGFVLPVLTSATGMVFFSYLPEAYWADLVAEEEALTPGALDEARSRAVEVRRHRLAMTEGKFQSGFFGISSPIFGMDANIQASITALGISAFENPASNTALKSAMRETAKKISLELGCPASLFSDDDL